MFYNVRSQMQYLKYNFGYHQNCLHEFEAI